MQLIKTSNINRNCAYEFNNDATNPNPSSNVNQNVNAAAHAEALSRTFKNELEEILVSTHNTIIIIILSSHTISKHYA